MTNLNSLLQKLKKEKLRKTKLCIFLLKIMLNNSKPLSVKELLNIAVKYKVKIHKTSVYRQLILLKEKKIIKEIQFGENKKRYEIYSDNHHHHFICSDCGYIEDVKSEICVKNLEKKIVREKRFKIINHSLEFFGLCVNCKS